MVGRLANGRSPPARPWPALLAARRYGRAAVRAPTRRERGAVGAPLQHRHVPCEVSVRRADTKLGSTVGKRLALRGLTSQVA